VTPRSLMCSVRPESDLRTMSRFAYLETTEDSSLPRRLNRVLSQPGPTNLCAGSALNIAWGNELYYQF